MCRQPNKSREMRGNATQFWQLQKQSKMFSRDGKFSAGEENIVPTLPTG